MYHDRLERRHEAQAALIVTRHERCGCHRDSRTRDDVLLLHWQMQVKFEGEGVDDYGGPYREVFTQVAAELTATARSTLGHRAGVAARPDDPHPACLLPLLAPSTTCLSRQGAGLDMEFNVLANVRTPRLLQLYKFLGRLIGIAIRCQVIAPWSLSRVTWKALVGEALQEEDLAHIDPDAHALLRSVRCQLPANASTSRDTSRGHEGHESQSSGPSWPGQAEEDFDGIDRMGREGGAMMQLRPGESQAIVKADEIALHLQAVVQARIHEGDRAMFAVRDGLASVLPRALLPLLTWEEMRMIACGRAQVDIDLLEANTEYDDDLSASDEHIQSFWRVLRGFDHYDRSQFLRFVWARSRLPTKAAHFHQKFKIHNATDEGAKENPDLYLPKAHTCFFSINLPRYTSDAIMAQKLTYTMYNCIEMDADFRLTESELSGWVDDAPRDDGPA